MLQNSFANAATVRSVDGWWSGLNNIGHTDTWTWGGDEQVVPGALYVCYFLYLYTTSPQLFETGAHLTISWKPPYIIVLCNIVSGNLEFMKKQMSPVDILSVLFIGQSLGSWAHRYPPRWKLCVHIHRRHSEWRPLWPADGLRMHLPVSDR